jgi:hypothetical protein
MQQHCQQFCERKHSGSCGDNLTQLSHSRACGTSPEHLACPRGFVNGYLMLFPIVLQEGHIFVYGFVCEKLSIRTPALCGRVRVIWFKHTVFEVVKSRSLLCVSSVSRHHTSRSWHPQEALDACGRPRVSKGRSHSVFCILHRASAAFSWKHDPCEGGSTVRSASRGIRAACCFEGRRDIISSSCLQGACRLWRPTTLQAPSHTIVLIYRTRS